PPISPTERFIFPASSSKTRRPATLSAKYPASSSASLVATPISTSSPRAIRPTTSPRTVTSARLTRCTTARITKSPEHNNCSKSGHTSGGVLFSLTPPPFPPTISAFVHSRSRKDAGMDLSVRRSLLFLLVSTTFLQAQQAPTAHNDVLIKNAVVMTVTHG